MTRERVRVVAGGQHLRRTSSGRPVAAASSTHDHIHGDEGRHTFMSGSFFWTRDLGSHEASRRGSGE